MQERGGKLFLEHQLALWWVYIIRMLENASNVFKGNTTVPVAVT